MAEGLGPEDIHLDKEKVMNLSNLREMTKEGWLPLAT